MTQPDPGASDPRVALVRQHIRSVPDFPKPGILFRDITPVLSHPPAMLAALELHVEAAERLGPFACVCGIESRGFLFGMALAARLSTAFVPVRKPGKLPADTIEESYALEYGSDRLQIHVDAISDGDRVLVVDDLLATGGTASTTCKLVRRLGGTVAGCLFLIELVDLDGRSQLGEPVETILKF